MGKKALLRYYNRMSEIPKDGTLLCLLVHYGGPDGYGSLEDSNVAWTIGFNTFKDTGEDEWLMAGWNWEQDCFTVGHGEIVDWKPFLSKKQRKQLKELRKRKVKK